MTKKALITGPSGLIGSESVKSFYMHTFEVIIDSCWINFLSKNVK